MPRGENTNSVNNSNPDHAKPEKIIEHIHQLRVSGGLSLEDDPQYALTRPWLLKLIGSLAEAPGPPEDKLPLITSLSRLLPQNQVFSLVDCTDRDQIVDLLLNNNGLPGLYEFLQAAFIRWNPKTGTKDDLAWLYNVLIKTMVSSQNTALLSLNGPQGKINVASGAYLELTLNETLLAAGETWVRCLRGPGGVETCQEMKFVLQERKLCEAILEMLAEDPLAFALLVENFNIDDLNCDKSAAVSMLAQGAMAAEYSLSSLFKACCDLKDAANEPPKDLRKLLKPVMDKIKSF